MEFSLEALKGWISAGNHRKLFWLSFILRWGVSRFSRCFIALSWTRSTFSSLVNLNNFKAARRKFNYINFSIAELIMFYLYAVLQSGTFLYLATKWKRIMQFWYEKEKPFLSSPYTTTRLVVKIRLIGALFFVLFLIEHVMFIVMEVHHNELDMNICNLTDDVPFLYAYLRRERPHLFLFINYHWWTFPIFQFTITCLSFSWNFVDYFIITLGVGLTTRFNQINARLQSTPFHQKDNRFWNEIRLHYTNLVDLLDYVNDFIPALLLLSMSHNVFLVMTKIFEAIK